MSQQAYHGKVRLTSLSRDLANKGWHFAFATMTPREPEQPQHAFESVLCDAHKNGLYHCRLNWPYWYLADEGETLLAFYVEDWQQQRTEALARYEAFYGTGTHGSEQPQPVRLAPLTLSALYYYAEVRMWYFQLREPDSHHAADEHVSYTVFQRAFASWRIASCPPVIQKAQPTFAPSRPTFFIPEEALGFLAANFGNLDAMLAANERAAQNAKRCFRCGGASEARCGCHYQYYCMHCMLAHLVAQMEHNAPWMTDRRGSFSQDSFTRTTGAGWGDQPRSGSGWRSSYYSSGARWFFESDPDLNVAAGSARTAGATANTANAGQATHAQPKRMPLTPALYTALRTLGLSVRADISIETIKKRYRVLALQHHPDKGGDTAKMAAINVAYRQVLKWAEGK